MMGSDLPPALRPHKGSSVTEYEPTERFTSGGLRPYEGSSLTIRFEFGAALGAASTPRGFVCNQTLSEWEPRVDTLRPHEGSSVTHEYLTERFNALSFDSTRVHL